HRRGRTGDRPATAAVWRRSGDQGPLARRRRERRLTATSLAGLAIPDLQRGELARDRKVVVVEHESTRNAVLVHLELDRVDGRLLAAAGLGAVEIAHRYRPALHSRQRQL